MNRRHILKYALGMAAGCGCGRLHAQWPQTSGEGPLRPVFTSSVVGGCALQDRDDLRKLSDIRYSESPDDRRLSEFLFYGSIQLSLYFDVDVNVAVFDDGDDANAFATLIPILGDGKADGCVLIGRRLIATESGGGDPWKSSLMVIAAHEHAHIVQLKQGLDEPNPTFELHADYLAGWVLGREDLRVRGGYVDVNGSAKSLFAKGSFAFNDPDFHGTPQQRVSAFRSGYATAQATRTLDAAFENGLTFVRRLRT